MLERPIFSTLQSFLFTISFFVFLNFPKMMDKFWTSKHHPLIMLFTIFILHLLYTFSNVFANNFTMILSFQFNSFITSSFTTFILPLLSNMVYKYNQVHPLWWKLYESVNFIYEKNKIVLFRVLFYIILLDLYLMLVILLSYY